MVKSICFENIFLNLQLRTYFQKSKISDYINNQNNTKEDVATNSRVCLPVPEL